MTHDKKLLDVKYSFSPVSLQDTEKPAQLAMTLEKVVLREGKEYLSAFLEENHARYRRNKVVSSAHKNTTPHLWIFGWVHTTPCM